MCVVYTFIPCPVLGIEPRTLCQLSTHSATELGTYLSLFWFGTTFYSFTCMSKYRRRSIFYDFSRVCLPILSSSCIRCALSMYCMFDVDCISSGREEYKVEIRLIFHLQVDQLGKMRVRQTVLNNFAPHKRVHRRDSGHTESDWLSSWGQERLLMEVVACSCRISVT